MDLCNCFLSTFKTFICFTILAGASANWRLESFVRIGDMKRILFEAVLYL